MNRRKFLSAIAAVPVVGPVAAMAAQAAAPVSQVVVEKMSTGQLHCDISFPAGGYAHWYRCGKDGWQEFINGEWVPVSDWLMSSS